MVDSYEKYIKARSSEPTEFGKVVMFSTMEVDKKNVQDNIGRIFNFCNNPDEYLNDNLLNSNPILFWDKQTSIEKYGISEANSYLERKNTYNDPHGIIVSKLDTLKILKKINFQWLPKTVFSRDEATKDLQFPIIAKASNTYQSRGVEKVSTKRNLSKLMKGFDIYQELIPIEEEYRVVFFRGKNKGIKMLAVFHRNPRNDKAKSLRVNEAGMTSDKLENREHSDFSWTQVNPRKCKNFNVVECYHIAKVIFDINPTLNVSGMDIAIDKSGKHYFIEANSTPGLFSNMIPMLYLAIYEDTFGIMSEYSIKRLNELSSYFVYLTKLDEPTFQTADNAEYNLFGYEYA